ncbi:MAG: glycoside hydrolase family 13 protein [Candidatus Symbiothrix sp.]|jgi:glycosidase|nr:glycoside hydrolase family 13 protein [Candidatus Symbiothrix sp.]
MKKTAIIAALFWVFSMTATAITISRVEPAFWWVGMKNPELQIMVYGKNIAASRVGLTYPGVALKTVVHVDNPNYLFIYLTITQEAKAGKLNLEFTEGKKSFTYPYELKARNDKTGAQGFDTSDVLYLIMPDRFANGDPSNDVMEGVPIDRKNSFARHGGDFAGISQHLNYIRDLGVSTIWLNPVLENNMREGSYHGYAITDFYKIDQRFGSNEDYCRLIEEIHGKGMKAVMDMIFNHCGSSHWWINDFPCKDWLNHQDGFVPTSHNLYAVADIHAPQSEVKKLTEGWFVPGMPDLNQRNPLLADYLIQNSIWWIEYARIDGIRHDTHPYADFDFLAKWCKAVENEYPSFNIVGESWYINSASLAWWQKNAKTGNRQSNLKTTMDFNLMNACNEAFPVDPDKTGDLRKIYEVLAQDFLYSDLDNILVFLDNHDLSRFVKQEENDLNRYKQALAFVLTTRGIPQLYYGTEILMSGEKSEGDGNLRKDFPGGWPEDANNAFLASGRTGLQNEAWNYLQTLLRWRKGNPAVKGGQLIHYAPDQTGCYVYARIKGESRVLVILNGSDGEQTVSPEKYREVCGNARSGKDIISGKNISLENKFTISGKGVYILELN